jgi:hypothetical protein
MVGTSETDWLNGFKHGDLITNGEETGEIVSLIESMVGPNTLGMFYKIERADGSQVDIDAIGCKKI